MPSHDTGTVTGLSAQLASTSLLIILGLVGLHGQKAAKELRSSRHVNVVSLHHEVEASLPHVSAERLLDVAGIVAIEERAFTPLERTALVLRKLAPGRMNTLLKEPDIGL